MPDDARATATCPVDPSPNGGLTRSVRSDSDKRAAQIGDLPAHGDHRSDSDTHMARAVAGWNQFADLAGSFANEHSTL